MLFTVKVRGQLVCGPVESRTVAARAYLTAMRTLAVLGYIQTDEVPDNREAEELAVFTDLDCHSAGLGQGNGMLVDVGRSCASELDMRSMLAECVRLRDELDLSGFEATHEMSPSDASRYQRQLTRRMNVLDRRAEKLRKRLGLTPVSDTWPPSVDHGQAA